MFPTAQRMSVLVDVAKDVVPTAVTDDVVAAPAGDGFGCAVPEHDPAVGVGDVGAIGQRLQQRRRIELL